MKPRLVIAGGSGFLGGALAEHFAARGWEIIVLTRQPRQNNGAVRDVGWDGETLGEWARELEGARALVNLAGVSVNCRYHARNRKLILDSRINSTRVLGEALAGCANPPEVWLNSSTATIYKHTHGPAWDETGEIGGTPEAKDGFSVEVAVAWERTFSAAPTPKTRKLNLRSAMVLGTARNSVFPVLRRLVRLGLGGSLAGGQQFVSWIHERDFCRAIEWLIEHCDLSGTFNLAAPNPVKNAELMGTLCKVCRMPFGLPASLWLLELGAFFLRTETELVIKSRRVVPGRLLKEGFSFDYPLLRPAFEDLRKRYQ
jgi:hypothetical protein